MDGDEDKSFKNNKINREIGKIKSFFSNKKVQLILTVLIFLIILVTSSIFRFSNLNLLVDPTTGDYTAADPDALYFMRLAHVVLEQGNLEGIDGMRAPGANITYLKEITPYTIVLMYKFIGIFSQEATLNFIAVISPVIFFILGLIVFFFLCYYITKSKLVALLSSIFLAFSPAYLFRTTSGVLDHDSIGMFAIFLSLLIFSIGIKSINKSTKKTGIWSILLGISTAFAMGAWAGGVTFLFMIIPVSMIIIYLFNLEGLNKEKGKLILFNLLWVASYFLFSVIIGFHIGEVVGKLKSASSLLVLLVLFFMITDFFLEKKIHKLKFLKEKYRVAYSGIILLFLGILALIISGSDIFSLLNEIYLRLINPFGSIGRLGATVSENAQPYLTTWISQTGKVIFWLFIGGMIFLGINFSKNIKIKKDKVYFMIFWVLAISGILFSRVSESSLFNGINFISQLFYIGSLVVFIGYLVWMYFHKRFTINNNDIIIFSWMIFMLLMGRAASRTIFVATPFVCFSAGYFVIKMIDYTKKAKDEIVKVLLLIASIAVIIIVVMTIFGNPMTKSAGIYQTTKYQGQYIGSALNYQWQNAMAWVRNNTNEEDIFVHWWDYGYLVQTGGERKTVSDGGHAATDAGDHNVGRYILTTPNPETALSYMKTWNVSYLLIDPTDLGKYAAYSRIGSDEEYDRYSSPFVLIQDESQTTETSTEKKVVYQGNSFVDEDIVYGDIFLPGPNFDKLGNPTYNSYVIGVLHSSTESSEGTTMWQPEAAFYYNGNQYRIPMRYLYYNGKITDFKTGIESTLVIIPQISVDSYGQVDLNPTGAAIYLSPKVSDGLFAKLYLMNDPFNEYSTISEAHFEDDIVISTLKQQGIDLGEFVYYDGLRGPLKIWEVDYPANTETHEEFLELASNWEGELDKLFE